MYYLFHYGSFSLNINKFVQFIYSHFCESTVILTRYLTLYTRMYDVLVYLRMIFFPKNRKSVFCLFYLFLINSMMTMWFRYK